jgi:hypothetical protein
VLGQKLQLAGTFMLFGRTAVYLDDLCPHRLADRKVACRVAHKAVRQLWQARAPRQLAAKPARGASSKRRGWLCQMTGRQRMVPCHLY